MLLPLAVFAPAIVFEAPAEPTFSGAPGYISVPVYTQAGDPGSWTSGIQSLDYDGAETFYVFAENRFRSWIRHGKSLDFSSL